MEILVINKNKNVARINFCNTGGHLCSILLLLADGSTLLQDQERVRVIREKI